MKKKKFHGNISYGHLDFFGGKLVLYSTLYFYNNALNSVFDWDPKSWKTNYHVIWKAFKDACNNWMGLHHCPKLVRPNVQVTIMH